MNKNKTNLILISSTVILIILISIFVYLFNVIRNKNKHISTVVTTLEEKILAKNNIGIFSKKMADLNNTNDSIGEFIVDSSKIDKFVGYLENLGNVIGVDLTVKGVNITKGEKNKISVDLNMIGDFPNIMKVISVLENSQYNITINSSYINKGIAQSVQDSTLPIANQNLQAQNKSQWSADISFSVLSI